METAGWLALLWISFALTHVVPSSARLRPRLVGALGPGPYLGLYSLVALGLFVPLMWLYLTHRHGGEMLWNLRSESWARPLSIAISGLGFTLLIASFAQPSALGMAPASPEVRGLARITRHPMNMGFVAIAVGHLLLNGFTNDLVFFGGLGLYGLLGSVAQDRRKRAATADRLAEYFEQTSILPFAAIVTGRNRLALAELPWAGLAIGALAAAGFYWLHGPMWLGG